MNPHTPRFALVLLLVAGGACKPIEDKTGGTPGDKGNVEFTYQSGCFFGCPLEQPLLSGTHQVIQVTDPGDVEDLTVRSSDEEVAVFSMERACFCERADSTRRVDIALDAKCDAPWRKHCDNRVQVEAVADGDARLELRDAHDAVLDRVTVLVRDADRAEFAVTFDDRAGTKQGTHFKAAPGDSLELAATLFDDAGRKLLATDGLKWRTTDAEVATLSAWLRGSGAEVSTGLSVTVQVKSAGSAEVGITVPGLDMEDAHVTVEAQP